MRIALATVGTTGDVAPFRSLARLLVDRGHQVTAVTWPVHRALLSLPGVRVEVAGPHADPARMATVAEEAARHGPMAQVAILRDFHLADGEAHYRQVRAVLPGHDLVLLHGIHVLAHAAVLDEGLRWATAVFDPVLLPTAEAPPPGMPGLGPANRLLWSLLDRAMRRTTGPLDAVLSRAGSDRQGLPLFRARSPRLHLVACSPSVMAVPSDLPAGARVTGAWFEGTPPDALPSEVESFLDAGRPPIVIGFGSMAGIPRHELAIAIRAILDAGRRVLAHGSPGVASPNLLVAGWLDHRALFPRAALVVHHGGAGTTHAACAAGAPSVVVPQIGDQRYWAERLRQLGAAPPPVSGGEGVGQRLAEAVVAAAADPRHRSAAQVLSGHIAGEDGLREAVRHLEAMAHD